MSDPTDNAPPAPEARDAAVAAPPAPAAQNVAPIRVEDEMHQSFLDYSMSVIVGRALPDARDGMKPVHRRCIYAMGEMGNTHGQAHKKSARVVGEVMGKYHPHGDASIYDTIVRLAQDFNMRYMLVDGHGNFGSIDGYKAAAPRYTEVRMQRFAEDMLEDLDKETVDMVPNYDGTLEEPTVLPSKLPNLLLNGSMGIAVGMATNIPTHNLVEVLEGVKALVRDPAITIDGLMEHVKGPDFPTGGIICGTAPIKQMYVTGRATLVVRARCEIVDKGSHSQILVHEVPYGINKTDLLQHIGELMDEKVLTGIAEVRDLSKDKVRIEIDLKQDAVPQVVLNLLFKHTALQSNFGANMLALDRGRPKVMNLKQFLRCFVEHRREVVERRTKFLLRKAKERAHLLEGFRTAIDNIDEIVHIIRSSQTDEEAKARMLEKFGLDDVQSSAILEMRLKQLTGLSRDKIEEEYKQVMASIERYEFVLANKETEIGSIIVQECDEMIAKYGDERRTSIEHASGEIDMTKIIANEKCVITLSAKGYVKRSSLDAFAAQKRGGKGRKGAKLKDEDYVERVNVAMTHDTLLAFTSWGRVYAIGRAWDLPEADPNSFGKPIVNFLPLQPAIKEGAKDKDGKVLAPRDAEKVLALVSLGTAEEAAEQFGEEAAATGSGRFEMKEGKEIFNNKQAVLFVTRKGIVKKTVLSEFKNVSKSGIKAINIDDDDTLVSAELVERGDKVVLVSAFGQALRFSEERLRPLGRASRGVRGMRLAGVTFGEALDDADEPAEEAAEENDAPALEGADRIVAAVKENPDETARILLLVENGYGTLNTFASYPLRNRGGKGVKSIKTGGRNGRVVFAAGVNLARTEADPSVETGVKVLEPADQVLVVTAKGQLVRTSVGEVRQTARNAMGVKVVSINPGDAVVSATVVPGEEAGEDGASPSGLPASPDGASPSGLPEGDASAPEPPPSPAERE
ncbi:MAG: DNA gyrase subunit A [Kiritimatiellae bacterium]|nr:DNA gyrase subunit A [Kiritimatiellia bacterium]